MIGLSASCCIIIQGDSTSGIQSAYITCVLIKEPTLTLGDTVCSAKIFLV